MSMLFVREEGDFLDRKEKTNIIVELIPTITPILWTKTK